MFFEAMYWPLVRCGSGPSLWSRIPKTLRHIAGIALFVSIGYLTHDLTAAVKNVAQVAATPGPAMTVKPCGTQCGGSYDAVSATIP